MKSVASPSSTSPPPPPTRNRLPLIAVSLIALIIIAAGGYAFHREREARAIDDGVKQIAELATKGQFTAAYQRAKDIEQRGGAAKLTLALQDEYSRPVNVTSTPPGAKIDFRPYDPVKDDGAWIALGTAPIENVRVPRGVMEWRATSTDGATHRLVTVATPNKQIAFNSTRAVKDGGEVEVPAGASSIGSITGLQVPQAVKLGTFTIDRIEVRNIDFARFVAAGGYTRKDYWQTPFTDGARTISFADAISRLKDATGRPGPALWKLGHYPEGEGEQPVRGVSWHEAAAYARFVGRSLPTLYHWYRADTGGDTFLLGGTLLPSANFSGKSPRVAMQSHTIGAFGAVDMAGNVREWVANATDKGHQIALGGSWLEVDYQYKYGTTYSPWERPADVGFRTMKARDAASSEVATAVVRERPTREASAIKPVTDAEYAIYARLYEKSRTPLALKVEPGEKSSPYWTRTKVSMATGYGNERMDAYYYAPKNAKPPYQAVVYMGGVGRSRHQQAL